MKPEFSGSSEVMEAQSPVPGEFNPNARVEVVENPRQDEVGAAATDLDECSDEINSVEAGSNSSDVDVPESDQSGPEGEGGGTLDKMFSKLESLHDDMCGSQEVDLWDWADKLYTSMAERLYLVSLTDAEFTGTEKDFLMKPNLDSPKGREALRRMQEFGVNEIRCVKGVVDFSTVSAAQTTIEGMTSDLDKNKRLGFKAFAEQFNNERPLPNGEHWDEAKVKEFAQENELEFHECSDMRTVQLVPREIHRYFKHYGGRAECRIRDGEKPRSNDGFDEK